MPNFPGLHRKNNVPAWQRLHQNHDGLRQWQKVRTKRSARGSKGIGKTGDPRAKTGHTTSTSMLTTESQGPRAKIMLYPYYFTMVATSAGKPNPA